MRLPKLNAPPAPLVRAAQAPEEFEDREDEWTPGEEDYAKLRAAFLRPAALDKLNAARRAFCRTCLWGGMPPFLG